MTDTADLALVANLQSDVATVGARFDALTAERDAARADAQALAAANTKALADLQAANVTIASLRATTGTIVWPGWVSMRGTDTTRSPWVGAWSNALGWKPDSNVRRNARVAALDLTKTYVTAAPVGTTALPATDNGFCEDMVAAYLCSVAYDLTGDARYRDRGVGICDAWANHPGIAPDNARNDKLWLAWATGMATLAVPLLGGHDRLVATLVRIAGGDSLPLLDHPQGPNWLAAFADARIGLAVARRDRTAMLAACDYWRSILPYVIYDAADGTPKARPGMDVVGNFYGPLSGLTDGMPAEYRRDASHTQLGLALLCRAALRARVQGIDLPTEGRRRIVIAYEDYMAPLAGQLLDKTATTIPAAGTGYQSGFELAISLYGTAWMPKSAAVAARVRPSPRNGVMIAETLTHAAF